MPSGFECRQRLIKQNPPKPTTPRKRHTENPEPPGPFHYEVPAVFCGRGYSKIRRAPAYTFGLNTPLTSKPAAKPNAPVISTRNMTRKGGPQKIVQGLISPRLAPSQYEASPGPAAYMAKQKMVLKSAPAYSMQPPVRPGYEDTSVWTPGPNMYWPPIPGKKPKAYSFNSKAPEQINDADMPGPGTYDPIFESQLPTKPAYSFGYRLKTPGNKNPAPNTYCQRKFFYPLKRGTAPSFGIRHSPFLGRNEEWLKPSSKTDLFTGGE